MLEAKDGIISHLPFADPAVVVMQTGAEVSLVAQQDLQHELWGSHARFVMFTHHSIVMLDARQLCQSYINLLIDGKLLWQVAAFPHESASS